MKIFTIQYAITERTGDNGGKQFIPSKKNKQGVYFRKQDANAAVIIFLRSKRNLGLKSEDFWVMEHELTRVRSYPIK